MTSLFVWQCVLVTGETQDHENLHLMMEDYDILVLTPKILENHLRPDKIPSLSAFSLLIFDECHHTRKGEPYNSVMKNYLQCKKKGEKDLPQVCVFNSCESECVKMSVCLSGCQAVHGQNCTVAFFSNSM